ncbi:MAG: type II toxin-antitoxin system VapC family toxin [Armatimonadetes bacterium]|nr:type II toxin-antitoxin system VapC family toxin [Armatimonadota bacterium]
MSDHIYFLDANVPLYALGGVGPLQEPSRRVMGGIASGALAATTDVQVLQEVLHHCGRSRRLDYGCHIVDGLVDMVLEVLSVTVADVRPMQDLMRQLPALPAHDALHLAVMRRHDITHIVTADRHFLAVPGITALDPHAAAALLAD